MNIINDGLPQPIFRAIKNTVYHGDRKADFSVTELTGSVYKAAFKRLHGDKITIPASERYWAILGNAVHDYLKEKNLFADGVLVEQRLTMDFFGNMISGQYDYLDYEKGLLIDYKVKGTGITGFLDREKEDHTYQLNIYRYMVEKETSHKINKLQIIYIFRDWNKMRVAEGSSYPDKPFMELDIPILPNDIIEEYLQERIKLFNHTIASIDKSPGCTDSERLKRPTVYSIIKKGGKRAAKNCDTFEEATHLLASKYTDPNYEIVTKPGESLGCKYYCECRSICDKKDV